MVVRARLFRIIVLALLFQSHPVFGQDWDPPAITVHPNQLRASHDPRYVTEIIREGRELFMTKFNIADGAGRQLCGWLGTTQDLPGYQGLMRIRVLVVITTPAQAALESLALTFLSEPNLVTLP